MLTGYISFSEFKRLDIRVGEVISAERIPGSKKLIKLKVNLGDEERQLVAGLAEHYQPDELIGKQIVVLTNLQPRKFMGVESQGMLLAAVVGEEGRPVLLTPEKKVPPGSPVS